MKWIKRFIIGSSLKDITKLIVLARMHHEFKTMSYEERYCATIMLIPLFSEIDDSLNR